MKTIERLRSTSALVIYILTGLLGMASLPTAAFYLVPTFSVASIGKHLAFNMSLTSTLLQCVASGSFLALMNLLKKRGSTRHYYQREHDDSLDIKDLRKTFKNGFVAVKGLSVKMYTG